MVHDPKQRDIQTIFNKKVEHTKDSDLDRKLHKIS